MKDIFDDETENKETTDFGKLLAGTEAKLQRQLSVGEKIRGEILSIGKDEIFVSTGTINDGVALKTDFPPDAVLKKGDEIELFVTQIRGGQIHLSPKPTAKNLADDLEDAFDMMLAVEGKVTEAVNGGFRVQLLGKLAFCPISQMDTRRIDKPEEYIGKKLEFRITQFAEGGRKIVVSRRKLLDEQRDLNRASFQEEHKLGQVLQGVVTRIEKFGAFVEVAPQIEGLVHISEISWSRIQDPNEVLSLGKQVAVKIIKMEELNGILKISLSIKQAGEEPWQNMSDTIRVGAIVEGRVTRCMKFGAFVEIKPGIEGLVPLSEMSYTRRVVRSDELIKEGDRVSVAVKEINEEDKKILLSLKDAGTDPWVLVTQKFPVGCHVEGLVQKREAYGLFIQLEPGIVGLFPKSKAKDQTDFPFERLKAGDKVKVQVDEINFEERKISLGVPGEGMDDSWKGFAKGGASMGTLGDQFKNLFDSTGKKK